MNFIYSFINKPVLTYFNNDLMKPILNGDFFIILLKIWNPTMNLLNKCDKRKEMRKENEEGNYVFWAHCITYTYSVFPSIDPLFLKKLYVYIYFACTCFDILDNFLFTCSVEDWERKTEASKIVDLSVSSLSSISCCFIYFEALFLDTYTFKIVFYFSELTLLSLFTILFIPDNFPCFEVCFIWY